MDEYNNFLMYCVYVLCIFVCMYSCCCSLPTLKTNAIFYYVCVTRLLKTIEFLRMPDNSTVEKMLTF